MYHIATGIQRNLRTMFAFHDSPASILRASDADDASDAATAAEVVLPQRDGGVEAWCFLDA